MEETRTAADIPTHAAPEGEGTPPDLQESPSGTPASPEQLLGAMSCAQCDQPVARADELLTECYGSTLSSSVYAYELEVLDADAWVYSATNPGDVRFDVCRFATPKGAHVHVSGRASADHSRPERLQRVVSPPAS